MKSFRTLDLAVEFYDLASQIPLTGNLRDQLHRAASAISLNLAEGNGKSSANEKRHFFQTAYASLRECQAVFRLAKVQSGPAFEAADRLGGALYRLVNSDIKNSPNWRRP